MIQRTAKIKHCCYAKDDVRRPYTKILISTNINNSFPRQKNKYLDKIINDRR